MTSPLQHALALADQGIPVFPVRADKRPACEHGHLDATIDPRRIRDMFEESGAPLVGFPTGEASGIDVLDVDPRHDGDKWPRLATLPATRTHRTGSGGLHYYFQHAEGVRNSQSKLGAGVDVRGSGGYAVAWPVEQDLEPAAWPADVLEAALRRPAPKPEARPLAQAAHNPTTDEARVALANAVKLIEAAVPGERYEACKQASWHLARLILGGFLDEQEARDAVIAAAEAAGGEDMGKVERLFDGALEKAEPATVPGAEFEALPPEPEPEPEADEGDGDWREMLQRGKPTKDNPRGPVVANLLNATLAFRYAPHWAGRLRFNLFTGRPEIDGRNLEDKDVIKATIWLQDNFLQIQKGTAADAMIDVAHKRAYHPIQDALRALKWDGVRRIDTWLSDFAGAEDTPLHRAYARKFLIALVARALRPGCKVDTVLILEGRQGLRKSSLFEVLCGREDWFMDDLGDIGAKDTLERLQGKWVIEIAELASLNRAEAAHIKAFLSRRRDTFRASYGRLPADYPRQCVFGGSVNPGSLGYLKDETGGRRFWPVECGVGWPDDRKIDAEALAAVRDQMIAEAVAAFLAGDTWWLDSHALEQSQNVAADARYEVDSWESTVAAYLENHQTVQVHQILANALGRSVKDQTRVDTNRVGAILKRLGWIPRNVRVDGKQSKRFVNPVPNVVPLREPGLDELSA